MPPDGFALSSRHEVHTVDVTTAFWYSHPRFLLPSLCTIARAVEATSRATHASTLRIKLSCGNCSRNSESSRFPISGICTALWHCGISSLPSPMRARAHSIVDINAQHSARQSLKASTFGLIFFLAYLHHAVRNGTVVASLLPVAAIRHSFLTLHTCPPWQPMCLLLRRGQTHTD